MNDIIKQETAIDLFGIKARAFNVVANTETGRILNQKIMACKEFGEGGKRYVIRANLRFDDECKNGHETFSITGEIIDPSRQGDAAWISGGCIHEEIEKHFPELAHLIKWHLTSTDGPMHYVASTLYHADQHGPDRAWVYYTGPRATDPLGLGADGEKERLLGYLKAEEANKAKGEPGYRVEWDQKTAKTANFDYARSSAAWPEATDEELSAPRAELEKVLQARLPALLYAFKADMLACGFLWPVAATFVCFGE